MDASLVDVLEQGRLELRPEQAACLVISRYVFEVVLLIDEFPCPAVAASKSATSDQR